MMYKRQGLRMTVRDRRSEHLSAHDTHEGIKLVIASVDIMHLLKLGNNTGG